MTKPRLTKPRRDPPRRTSGGVAYPVPPPVRPRPSDIVGLTPGAPRPLLRGEPPSESDRRKLVQNLEHMEFGWFDPPPSWWKVRARRRWRDRVPRGFR